MGATKKDRRINAVLSVLLTILCIAWMYPVFMILMNSLKTERAITTTHAFELPNAETFVGLKNYIYGIQEMDFLSSFWYSLVITVSSVALILLCCSMCAWYITRVQGVLGKGMYYLCVFSMIVPFQMVMFTLAKTADTLKLNNPYNICIIYLGFGAGLAVFMFTGFVKSMPIAIEEAAMIDGANRWQTFWYITLPQLRPTTFVVVIMLTISGFKVYDQMYMITQGGPGTATMTLVYYIYNVAFVNTPKYGYASAISMVLFVLVLIVTIIQFRGSKGEN